MEILLTDLEPIRESYKQGRLQFIVGAGASMAAGLPGWGELNNRLVASYFNASVAGDARQLFGTYSDSELEIIARTFASEFSKDAVIDLLRQRIVDAGDEEFTRLLHDALYDGISSFQIQALHYELAAAVHERTQKCGSGVIYTFNYDDILQTALQHFGHEVSTIVDDATIEGRCIVHLHGYLPFHVNDEGAPRVRGDIVLSEKDYLDSDGAFADERLSELLNDPEKDVLLLGMSMTDPRIRRLLHERVRAARSDSGNVWALLTQRQPDPDADIASRRATIMAAAHVRPYWESWLVDVVELPNHEALPTTLRLIRSGEDVGEWLQKGRDFLQKHGAYHGLYNDERQVKAQLSLLRLHDLICDRFEVNSDERFGLSFFVPNQDEPHFVDPCFRFSPAEREHRRNDSWREYPLDIAGISPLSAHVSGDHVNVLLLTKEDARERRLEVRRFDEVEGATGLAIATGNLIDARDSRGFFHNFSAAKRREWAHQKTYSSLLCVPVYDTHEWMPLGSVCISSIRRQPFWDGLQKREKRDLETMVRSTFRNLLGYESVF